MGGASALPIDVSARGRLLVVDDEAILRQTLALALEIEGYVVVTAQGGHEALALLGDEPPGAAVIDLQMPGMGGEELFAALKARFPSLPVILASGSPELPVAAARAGATLTFRKGGDLDELLALIEHAVRQRAATGR